MVDDEPNLDEPAWARASNFGRLEQRVSGLETAMRDIRDEFSKSRDQMGEIHRAIISIGKPRWGELATMAGTVFLAAGGLWTLTVSPINEKIVDEKAMIAELSAELRIIDAKKADSAGIDKTQATLQSRIDELNQKLGRK